MPGSIAELFALAQGVLELVFVLLDIGKGALEANVVLAWFLLLLVLLL